MENFNFNRDFYEACRALGERDGGRLAFALLRYGYEGAEPEKLPPPSPRPSPSPRGASTRWCRGAEGAGEG